MTRGDSTSTHLHPPLLQLALQVHVLQYQADNQVWQDHGLNMVKQMEHYESHFQVEIHPCTKLAMAMVLIATGKATNYEKASDLIRDWHVVGGPYNALQYELVFQSTIQIVREARESRSNTSASKKSQNDAAFKALKYLRDSILTNKKNKKWMDEDLREWLDDFLNLLRSLEHHGERELANIVRKSPPDRYKGKFIMWGQAMLRAYGPPPLPGLFEGGGGGADVEQVTESPRRPTAKSNDPDATPDLSRRTKGKEQQKPSRPEPESPLRIRGPKKARGGGGGAAMETKESSPPQAGRRKRPASSSSSSSARWQVGDVVGVKSEGKLYKGKVIRCNEDMTYDLDCRCPGTNDHVTIPKVKADKIIDAAEMPGAKGRSSPSSRDLRLQDDGRAIADHEGSPRAAGATKKRRKTSSESDDGGKGAVAFDDDDDDEDEGMSLRSIGLKALDKRKKDKPRPEVGILKSPEKVKDWPFTQPSNVRSPTRPSATNLAGAMRAQASPSRGPQTQADEVLQDSSSTTTTTTGQDAEETGAAGGGGRLSLLGNFNLWFSKKLR